MSTLVEKAREGKIAIGLDCTPKQMLSILKVVWPDSPSNYLECLERNVFDFSSTCIQKSIYGEYWIQMYAHEKTPPIVSAKDFLKEIAAVQIQVTESTISKPKRGKKIGLTELVKMAYIEMPTQFRAYQLANKCKQIDFTRKGVYIDTFMRVVRKLRSEGAINYIVINKTESLYQKES